MNLSYEGRFYKIQICLQEEILTMEDLRKIKVEKQTHPDLSILSPFDLAVEYSELPMKEF